MESSLNTKPNRNKAKGNLFENKVAKELGIWMFNDKDMLNRHLTSGAQKSAWVGDIIPQKQLPLYFNNGEFPFLIECKNGYKANIPNLNNQTIIRQWLSKAISETTKTQNVIYLITSFHSYSPLLFTDVSFNLTSHLILNLNYNNKIIPFYIYEYRKLLAIPFYSLYENCEEIITRLNKIN